METQGIPTRSNREPDQSDEPAVAEAVYLDQFRDARLNRWIDYLNSSLEKDDPLEANLGSINSGLIRVGIWLDEAIEKELQSGPPKVERLARILPAIVTQLKLTRQVDQFAQTELHAVEARQPKPANGKSATRRLDAPTKSVIGQSEEIEV